MILKNRAGEGCEKYLGSFASCRQQAGQRVHGVESGSGWTRKESIRRGREPKLGDAGNEGAGQRGSRAEATV